ncbi:MAG: SRPBCC domain-containing protein [Bacteroidetes bacterium]|nr:MAG: SRPBCC domain-containing protein [Bacteroidota bacterium]
MTEKVKIELEYLLKTSPKVLENMLCTPSGLSEWFADDVNIKDDVFTFIWDGSEENARIITKKPGSKVRFQWLRDEEEENECFFEMRVDVDPITKDVVLQITDFADSDEEDEVTMLWDQSVSDLKRVLGA